MGYTGNQLIKHQETSYLHKKSFPQIIIPKIESMGYTAKLIKNKTQRQ